MAEPLARPDLERVTNLPNALTAVGYGAAIVWAIGGPTLWPFALASILADHYDGKLARALGESSEFGASFDRTVDVTLTGLAAYKLGPVGMMALPAITVIQASTENDSFADSLTSWRSVLMGIVVAKQVLEVASPTVAGLVIAGELAVAGAQILRSAGRGQALER